MIDSSTRENDSERKRVSTRSEMKVDASAIKRQTQPELGGEETSCSVTPGLDWSLRTYGSDKTAIMKHTYDVN